MKNNASRWSLILMIGLLAPVASAAILSHTVSTGDQSGSWTAEDLLIPQFEVPEEQQLYSVEIRFTGQISGVVGVENMEDKFDVIFASLGGFFGLYYNGESLLSLDVAHQESLVLEPFNTELDYDGPSGETLTSWTASGMQSVTFSASDDAVSEFFGSGNVTFSASGRDDSYVQAGAGNPAFYHELISSGEIEVIYTYGDVVIPEPSHLMPFGGLVGFLFFRSQRRRHAANLNAAISAQTDSFDRVSSSKQVRVRTRVAAPDRRGYPQMARLEPTDRPSPDNASSKSTRKRYRRSEYLVYYGLLLLFVGALPVNAESEPVIAGFHVAGESIHLFVQPETNRYVIEQIDLGGVTRCAVGYAEQAVGGIALTGPDDRLVFFRVLAGLTPVFMVDARMEAAVRDAVGLNKIQPANWLYDADLAGLDRLALSGQQIQSLEGLPEGMVQETLDLGGNRLPTLQGLPVSPSLRCLRVDGNTISSLAGLPTLAGLVELDASHNQIVDLQPLMIQTGLNILYLDANNITDLVPLARLLDLRILDLANNRITSLSPLLANAAAGGLGLGDVVNLVGNPLADENEVATLRGYGIDVIYP